MTMAHRSIARSIAAVILAGFLAVAIPTQARTKAAQRSAPATVIAIVEDGMNLLHSDFAVLGGSDARLPARIPEVTRVNLPDSGSFEDRLRAAQAGPLGHLKEDTLYYVRGTRVLVYSPPNGSAQDAFADRSHGTGVAGAAVGLEHGTNPDALLVIVVDTGPQAWEWLAQQSWIDAVSTSYITILNGTERCHEAPHIKDIVDQGRLVFSAVGNGEQFGEVGSPSGVPQSYQVGGVDSDGRTFLPPQGTSSPNRPYETGDRYDFPSADSESLSGSMDFGGTSGATPSTAGRATELLQYARTLLGSSFTGVRGKVLARATRPGRAPQRGPLADGDLTAAELTDVLHHIARPAEAASPIRYLLEGYGALNHDEVLALGKRVLWGTARIPARAQEDAMHETIEAARAAAYFEGRCT
jgi:hypothetical protein